MTLLCGLTLEKINQQGGMNINKYLAYTALSSSATDPWPEFDLTKTIVVDDFESLVPACVDFIDRESYEITRKNMEIPITHTDGCGMILPRVSRKNVMIRAPWIKGLLSPFDFHRFIKSANEREPGVNHGIVKDIYGVVHDVLAEGIEVILTKSQFKMWKYYQSWDEYRNLFFLYHCAAGKCNEEEDFIQDGRYNYQYLQTLSDMTDDELKKITSRTVDKIEKIAANRDEMLKAFGAVDKNQNRNAFQDCLRIYPELLSDSYTREILKQIKKSLIKRGRAGKFDVNGKFLFLVPDLYAVCEYLFLGDQNPKGLLQDGEVSAALYQEKNKLVLLRSPHLFREYGVRENICNKNTKRWFSKRAVYTSCHDAITKILMFDVDGDKSLVVADDLIISVAERHIQSDGIVPLYYEMAKAGNERLSAASFYAGLRAAWKYGKIGVMSNNITKLWNCEKPDLRLIKLLCMESNFAVDAAKTLFVPERPPEIDDEIKPLLSVKTPRFFMYAKDKNINQVAEKNNSVVNRLENIIPDKRLSFTAKNIGSFRYRYLLSSYRAKVTPDRNIINLYDEISKKYRYAISFYDDAKNYAYIRDMTLNQFAGTGRDLNEITDILVKYLFCERQTPNKALFWLCFGDRIFENLKRNLPEKSKQCERCGERFVPSAPQQRLCKNCSSPKRLSKKMIICADCGYEFEISVRNTKTIRCRDCGERRKRELKSFRNIKYRDSHSA